MRELNDLRTDFYLQKHADSLREAADQRLVAEYLRETRPQRTWRFRLAEALLRLATVLSPHHRAIVHSGRRSGGTIII